MSAGWSPRDPPHVARDLDDAFLERLQTRAPPRRPAADRRERPDLDRRQRQLLRHIVVQLAGQAPAFVFLRGQQAGAERAQRGSLCKARVRSSTRASARRGPDAASWACLRSVMSVRAPTMRTGRRRRRGPPAAREHPPVGAVTVAQADWLYRAPSS
jgi:hypothetical protein